jgi:succinate dehydrogenase/fumarate reductase flavoprotein subunit
MEVDLLVAGGGAAGMATALAAALEGLDVVLCEKSDQLGGTTATSAGTVWIPGNTQSVRAGLQDSARDAEIYLQNLIGDSLHPGKLAAYLGTGPAAIDYFAARSEVKFLPAGRHPDYRALPGAAVSGRALSPMPFDGRLLGDDFKRVRPPIEEFLVLGGMMVGKADIPRLVGRFRSAGNFAYSLRLLCGYLMDRLAYPRGARLLMGNALVARLLYSLRRKFVPLHFNASIEEILRDDAGVVGAKIRHGGSLLAVKARKGVVLATGGYGRCPELRSMLMPKEAANLSLAYEGNTGDGLMLGKRIGVTVPSGHRTGAFWAPVSVTRRRDGSQGLFPHLVLDRAKPGLIAVNSAGRRFVNEACSYHDFVEAMFDAHKLVPAIPAYLICDSSFVRKYGLGAIHPGTRDLGRYEQQGYVRCAGSLEELAAKLSIDRVALEETVARHNSFAAPGVDLDFGKGSAELDRANGDPEKLPNPCIGKIEHAPFCALAVWPADLGVSTGLETDPDGRALGANGAPIPGLYACGNDMASIFMGTYPGPGTTLGPALTFAYRIAMHAAHLTGRP